MSEVKHQWRSFYPDLAGVSAGSILCVEGSEHHFLSRVLRLRQGSLLEVFDGHGHVASCRMEQADKKKATLTVMSQAKVSPPEVEVHLFLATPKQSTLEEALDLAFQLGFTHAHIFKSDKTHHKGNLKPEKLNKIALECLRVTREAWRPQVGCYDNLDHVKPALLHMDTLLFCDEAPVYNAVQGQRSLLEAAHALPPHSKKVGLLIGPEASFSPSERESIASLSHQSVLLGQRILKVPAAVAAAGAILGMWRDDV